MEVFTKSGLSAVLEGIDISHPRFIHGTVTLNNGKIERAIWFLDGRAVGNRPDINLNPEVSFVALPVFVLKPIEKQGISSVS